MLDRAEERTGDAARSTRRATTPWEWIAVGHWPRDGALQDMAAIGRHALELAVSEELERQAMAGEAYVLGARWVEAETVAAIADDMFVPESIREWMRRRRPSDAPPVP